MCHCCPVGPRYCNKPHLAQDSRVPGEAAERRVAREGLVLLRILILFMFLYLVVLEREWNSGSYACWARLLTLSPIPGQGQLGGIWIPGAQALSFEANLV